MNPNIVWYIKFAFGMCAALLAILAASLSLLEALHEEKQDSVRAWFEHKWIRINNSPWLSLPERATWWLLNRRTAFSKLILKCFDNELVTALLIVISPVFFSIGWWLLGNTLLQSIFFGGIFVLLLFFLLRGTEFFFLVFAFLSLFNLLIWFPIILKANVYYAPFIMIAILPMLAFWCKELTKIAIEAPAFYSDPSLNFLTLLFVGASFGFAATLIALLLGHLIDPSAYVPKTLQMLFSNAVFDGLTLAISFLILETSLTRRWVFKLPIAIILVGIIAAIFACSALYLGMLSTDHQLSIKNVLTVLTGKSLEREGFDLSPYFWAMHTTFLPTLSFLLFLLCCWSGKALLIPTRWFFGKGHEHKNPLKLTAAFCTLISVLFGFFAFASDSLLGYVEKVQDNKQIERRNNQ